jgi:hypothetical protein
MLRMGIALAMGLVAIGGSQRALADRSSQPASAPASRFETYEINQAESPLPTVAELQFEPSYTFREPSTRYKAELMFEGLLPYRAFLIPGLHIPRYWSLARVQVAVRTFADSAGTATGLTDLGLADVVAHRLGPVHAGLGVATVFPTATNPVLGQGKWQLGPAAALRTDIVPRLKAAVLVQNLYSIAGSSQRSSLTYVTVQPFLVLDLPRSLFLSSDATMEFYGRGGRTTVPINLGFGRAFGAHLLCSVRTYYTVAGANQGSIKVEGLIEILP